MSAPRITPIVAERLKRPEPTKLTSMMIVALELCRRAVIKAPTPTPLKRLSVTAIRNPLSLAPGYLLHAVARYPHAVKEEQNTAKECK